MKLRRKASQYTLVNDVLYKRPYSFPFLHYLTPYKVEYAFHEPCSFTLTAPLHPLLTASQPCSTPPCFRDRALPPALYAPGSCAQPCSTLSPLHSVPSTPKIPCLLRPDPVQSYPYFRQSCSYTPYCYIEPALAACAPILLHRAYASYTMCPIPRPYLLHATAIQKKQPIPDKIGIISD
ncbi:hypothetical protein SLEP1_g39541 [Rubroshorea leprosula]|uniref:Uncharacterized protein n=1 Tax=Rubroshorea leprosula TaxID=152421 RepID=A0AAV5L1P6_9ROSI|nr:hypothetical protein SLEP1_g39541 [Rubroshorea leprosula]